MKPRSSEMRGGSSRHGLARTLAGSLALAAAVVLGVLAVSYPVAAVLVGAFVLAAGDAVRRAVGLLRERRREGRSRTVCVDRAGVCVEV